MHIKCANECFPRKALTMIIYSLLPLLTALIVGGAELPPINGSLVRFLKHILGRCRPKN